MFTGTHFHTAEILATLTSDDAQTERAVPTDLRTGQIRRPIHFTNAKRTTRRPVFLSLSSVGAADVPTPEPEPLAAMPSLSVFLERCRKLGLIGQEIEMFGGLVTEDVLRDFYEAEYQAGRPIDRRITAEV